MHKKRVILFGKSIILGTIGASLRRYPNLDVKIISQSLPDVSALRDQAPEAIIYDIKDTNPELAQIFLETGLNLLLVGIDPDNNQVLVWSGRHVQDLSTSDLVQMICAGDANISTLNGGLVNEELN